MASTSVGCYAGSAIMSGLLQRRIPLLVRRVVTLIPALAILSVGVDPTWALVLSQVFLSIGIPFALIPLVRYTGMRSVMGRFINSIGTQVFAWVITAAIIALNLLLIYLTVTGAQ